MTAIEVHASRPYQVLLASGCLPACGERLRQVNDGTAAVLVSDETVNALYGDMAEKSLQQAGYRVQRMVLVPGETSKNGESYLRLLEFFARAGLTRADVAVALGGGVIGDLTGFAAATYLRGIDCVQLPTTLLAMVDSSVGGKTGINLSVGKNLAGAFAQPRLVLCDTETLRTLSPELLAQGAAEMIKCGMIADGELLTALRAPLAAQTEELIARCVRIKCALVESDERDNGARRLLNFGHTVAHAVERMSDYRISHGEAVGIGMSAMTLLAERGSYCAEGLYWELHDLLRGFGLTDTLPYTAEELVREAFHDKKYNGRTICVVLPVRRGCCVLHELEMEELARLFRLCEH